MNSQTRPGENRVFILQQEAELADGKSLMKAKLIISLIFRYIFFKR
ncbi:hypothetical protein HOLDEFILI_02595 [Holdemania filiformis DSM 12042]|uniref:Uncharacterized protein n=1 Tax=Holdemania filiformis DSM 12042 TaxID=545696 RepID=B9Y9T8_9FIRM|nr:hypothetical protein HOLDEFILI_02595 [Holdemania filiformis DSM 12042]